MVELFIILDIVKYCEFKIVLRMLILIDGKLKKVKKKIIIIIYGYISVYKCKRMYIKLFFIYKMSIFFVFNFIKKMKFKWLIFFVWIDFYYLFCIYVWIGVLF